MKKPTLIIMAAGMGSRYGGLKQIDPVDEYGHIIMDFSIYDAIKAGFEKVIFIIKKENEQDFKEKIGNRMEQQIQVEYVYQEIENLPEGFSVPEGRVKPWGTAHAVLSCLPAVDGPFAVINADDYYGQQAFQMIYDQLLAHEDTDKFQYTMVGYLLENTLTENGHVARGVCETNDSGKLTKITERVRIEKQENGPAFTEDDGATWTPLAGDAVVSMNMWGFTKSMMAEIRDRFAAFLTENLDKNPLKCEYFLPFVVDELIREGRAEVTVLKSKDRWYGVTYREDKPVVVKAIQSLKEQGLYPQKLWN